MSLPELRCLLCDRALLDETTALPSERCQQCGKLVRLGEPAVAPTVPPGEQAGFMPGEGSLLTTPFDELPEAVPVVLPSGDIPVVQPRVEPPTVRPFAARPPTITRPNWEPPKQAHPLQPPREDEVERPKPRVGCALLVVLGCMLLAILAITFIVYAIARGLKRMPKTEATPTKVVAEATEKGTPDQPKPRDLELVPVPATALWVPPRGTFPLGTETRAATADAPLPGAAPYGVLAGGGRFVLFPVPSAQMIAVFDNSTATVVGYLPMADADSLLAGSANHAFVLAPATQTLHRFDLGSLKLERTELFGTRFGDPLALAGGHAAGGPLYLLASDNGAVRLQILNTDTLQPIPWIAEVAPFKKPFGAFTGNSKVDRAYLRASASGRVLYGGIAKGQQNYRVDKLELFGLQPSIAPTTISQDRPAFPTADGGATAFEGVAKITRFPMAEGNGYFEIADKAGGKVLAMTFNGEPHVQRAEVKGIADFADGDGPNRDRRAFYIPSSQAFVHLGADGRTIHWRRVKLSEELPKTAGQDYLVVAGTPPASALRDQTFQYEPKVLSSAGDSVLKIETGPPGMRVEAGRLVWEVPPTLAVAEVRVELAFESKLKPDVAAKLRFTLALPLSPPTASGALFAPKAMVPRAIRNEKAGASDAALKFTGDPVKSAKRGQAYRAKLPLTTPEDAAVHIRAAPVGVAWDGGDLVWNVPADAPLEPVPIVVAAQTPSGKQVASGYLLEIRE